MIPNFISRFTVDFVSTYDAAISQLLPADFEFLMMFDIINERHFARLA